VESTRGPTPWATARFSPLGLEKKRAAHLSAVVVAGDGVGDAHALDVGREGLDARLLELVRKDDACTHPGPGK